MTRTRIAIFAVFAAFVLASLGWIVHPWYDMSVDSSIYIITARSLVAGDGYTYLGEPFTMRPPGFSLLIAPILAVAGTDFRWLNLFAGLWGAAAVLLLFFFERPRLGFGLALLVALAVWLNPSYQRLSTQILSEVPGAALLLACLLVERWARARPSWRRELVLGLCIGAASYVRAILVLLVPAIALSRLIGGRGGDSWPRFVARRVLPFGVVALLVLAPWSIRNQYAATTGVAEQTLVHSYGSLMLRADPADPSSPLLDPSELLARTFLRARQVASVIGSRMRNDYLGNYAPGAELGLTHLLFALAVLASGAVALWRRREPAEIFAFAALLVILGYGGFGGRLVLPVYLILLPTAVEAVRSRAGAVTAGAILSLLIARDFAPRRDLYDLERQHRAYADLARAVSHAVGPDDRLGAPIGAHYSVFLERPVYSLRHVARRSRDLSAVGELIERHRLTAVVVATWMHREDALTRYLRERYGPPERLESALLWRVSDASAGSRAEPIAAPGR